MAMTMMLGQCIHVTARVEEEQQQLGDVEEERGHSHADDLYHDDHGDADADADDGDVEDDDSDDDAANDVDADTGVADD
eukprot:2645427-Pyramimonas_sp.AAC.1